VSAIITYLAENFHNEFINNFIQLLPCVGYLFDSSEKNDQVLAVLICKIFVKNTDLVDVIPVIRIGIENLSVKNEKLAIELWNQIDYIFNKNSNNKIGQTNIQIIRELIDYCSNMKSFEHIISSIKEKISSKFDQDLNTINLDRLEFNDEPIRIDSDDDIGKQTIFI